MVSTLCWGEHCTTLASALDSLYTCQDSSDLLIVCQGRKIPVHRLVLAANSPFLAGLLLEVNTTLSLDGITYSQVSLLVSKTKTYTQVSLLVSKTIT